METDPWFWSVAEVLDFFYHRAAAYVGDLPHSQLPSLDSFTQALAENQVSGAVLLKYVDASFLRQDCALTSLGVRATVLYLIEKLRKHSRHYSQPDEDERQDSKISVEIPPNADVDADNAHEPNNPDAPAAIGQNLRAGEHHVEDEHARKRRKLNLPVPAAVYSPAASDTGAVSYGYFGDSALPVDKLFFSDVALGQEVSTLPVDDSLPSVHEDGDDFQFYGQPKASGERQYVWSRMRYFFNTCDRTEFQRRDRPALAILPYHEKLIPQGKPRSGLVVYMRDDLDNTVATRENAAFIFSGIDYNGMPQTVSSEWDFLLLKHQGTEELPLYQKSAEEDITSSLDKELEAEEQELAQEATKVLARSEVAEIVDQEIDEFVRKWQEKQLPRKETEARIVWRKMKRSKVIRDALIESAQAQILKLNARLQKQKDGFLKDDWVKVEELRRVCNVMEVTVEDRQYLLWKLDVWNRRQEPPGAVQRPQQTRTKSSTHESATPLDVLHDDIINDLPAHQDGDLISDLASPQGGDLISDLPAPQDSNLVGDLPTQQDETDPTSHVIDPSYSNSLPQSLQQSVNEPEPDKELGVSNELSAELGLDEQGLPSAHSSNAFGDNVPSALQMSPANATTSAAASVPELKTPEPDSESDMEELPSPQLFARLPRRESLSNPRKHTQDSVLPGSTNSDPIDLDSEPFAPTASRPTWHDDPLAASFTDVQQWNSQELARKEDRSRLLIKLLSLETKEYREILFLRFKDLRPVGIVRELRLILRALQRHRVEEPQLEAGYDNIMRKCTRMALAWLFSNAQLMNEPMSDEEWNRVPSEDSQFYTFWSWMDACLRRRKSKLFEPRDPGETSITRRLSATAVRTPRKKDTPRIKSDEKAQKSRNKAIERQEKFNFVTKSQPFTLSTPNIVINPAKKENEKYIYVHARIAKQMKPHQIEGVRFMWREIANDGNEGAQGCILAHTMGLGKTMQTIALLVAVNETASSKDPAIREQLPPELRPAGIGDKRDLRMLIVCPPSLLGNWERELDQWAPSAFVQIRILTESKRDARLKTLSSWHGHGGVLVISYDILRKFLVHSEAPSERNHWYYKNRIPIDKYLRLGPELIIVDEAHKIKNPNTTSLAMHKMRSESRIGLSGTPMENDVPEIYSLLSFVAPGYLGPRDEFDDQYTKPIKQGLTTDSSAGEYRKSLKRLKVLVTQTNPKINRADHTVLKGVLRAKVEFVITVALRKTQVEIYNKLIENFIADHKDADFGMGSIFAWLANLTLIANHPSVLRRKLVADLEDRKKPKSGKQRGRVEALGGAEKPATQSDAAQTSEYIESIENSGDESAEVPDVEVPGTEAPDLNLNTDAISELIACIEHDIDPALSPKMAIFIDILHLCQKCGDKLLVFSSYVSTLNYLGELLAQQRVSYERIDGKVKPKERLPIVDGFNQGKCSVLLISTKAGGTGLNLPTANRVVIFDFGFNPAWEEQAVGRSYRLGQGKPVFVYHFATGGTIEWIIYNKRLFKKALALRIVDHQNPPRYDNSKVREYLNPVTPVAQHDVTQWIGKDPLVLDHIIARHNREGGLLNAVATMEVLQEDAGEDKLTEEEQREVNAAAEAAIARRGKGKRVLRKKATETHPTTVTSPTTARNPTTLTSPTATTNPSTGPHPWGETIVPLAIAPSTSPGRAAEQPTQRVFRLDKAQKHTP